MTESLCSDIKFIKSNDVVSLYPQDQAVVFSQYQINDKRRNIIIALGTSVSSADTRTKKKLQFTEMRFSSLQDFPKCLHSFSTVLDHVFLERPIRHLFWNS